MGRCMGAACGRMGPARGCGRATTEGTARSSGARPAPAAPLPAASSPANPAAPRLLRHPAPPRPGPARRSRRPCTSASCGLSWRPSTTRRCSTPARSRPAPRAPRRACRSRGGAPRLGWSPPRRCSSRSCWARCCPRARAPTRSRRRCCASRGGAARARSRRFCSTSPRGGGCWRRRHTSSGTPTTQTSRWGGGALQCGRGAGFASGMGAERRQARSGQLPRGFARPRRAHRSPRLPRAAGPQLVQAAALCRGLVGFAESHLGEGAARRTPIVIGGE
jgi:translation initiation factor IF-2